MSKKFFAKQLSAGQKVIDFFYVEEKSLKLTKSGKPYLDLKLRDKTGSIPAKVWDGAESCSSEFDEKDYVKIKGITESYLNNTQLRIERIRKAKDDEIDEEDFFSTSNQNISKMVDKLKDYFESVSDSWIKTLLNEFVKDEEFLKDFARYPAAKMIHHTYIGGLLEHTLSMMDICTFLADYYGDLNKDLLIAGAFLHDIGKIKEISIGGGFSYTDEGELLGHTVMGMLMLNEKISLIPDFPSNTAYLLQHMILSHQGQPEWGSPKRPLFKEALILHYVDDIDAKVNIVRSYLPSEENDTLQHQWSDKCWVLEGRKFLNIKKYMDSN